MTSVYCSIGSNSTEYDDAMGRRVFLALLGVIDDTTVTKRGGSLRSNTLRTFLLNYWVPDVRLQDDEWITAWIEALIKADDSSIDACLSLLELQFEEERLTAGGTADALAGTRLVNSFLEILQICYFLLICTTQALWLNGHKLLFQTADAIICLTICTRIVVQRSFRNARTTESEKGIRAVTLRTSRVPVGRWRRMLTKILLRIFFFTRLQ